MEKISDIFIFKMESITFGVLCWINAIPNNGFSLDSAKLASKKVPNKVVFGWNRINTLCHFKWILLMSFGLMLQEHWFDAPANWIYRI